MHDGVHELGLWTFAEGEEIAWTRRVRRLRVFRRCSESAPCSVCTRQLCMYKEVPEAAKLSKKAISATMRERAGPESSGENPSSGAAIRIRAWANQRWLNASKRPRTFCMPAGPRDDSRHLVRPSRV